MLEKIRATMAETLNIDEKDIVPEARLAEDLDLDSLSSVELAMELEEEHGIKISDEELSELKTVQDIVDLLESKTSK